MYSRTHTAGAALGYGIYVQTTLSSPSPSEWGVIGAGFLVSLIAGTFPDIDHSNSLISSYFNRPGGSGYQSGHRGFTHSLFFLGLLTATGLYLMQHGWMTPPILAAVLIGVGSHILLDALSGTLELFWPFPHEVGGKLVPVGSGRETVVRWMLNTGWMGLYGYFLVLALPGISPGVPEQLYREFVTLWN